MDPNSPEFRKAALELRARAITEDFDLDARLKNALEPRYWQDLNPGMTICTKDSGGLA